MRVNLHLEDGNNIYKCYLYPEDVRNGFANLTEIEDIENALGKVLWGRKLVSFQSGSINGKTHVNQIKSWDIV